MKRLRGSIANLCVLAGLVVLSAAGWLFAPVVGLAVGGASLLLVGGLLAMGDR